MPLQQMQHTGIDEIRHYKTLTAAVSASTICSSGRFGVPCSGIWERVFTTDDRAFGGTSADTQAVSSEPVPCHGQAQSVALSLPPLSCEIWRCVRKAIR